MILLDSARFELFSLMRSVFASSADIPVVEFLVRSPPLPLNLLLSHQALPLTVFGRRVPPNLVDMPFDFGLFGPPFSMHFSATQSSKIGAGNVARLYYSMSRPTLSVSFSSRPRNARPAAPLFSSGVETPAWLEALPLCHHFAWK